jgi:hypothetical protein
MIFRFPILLETGERDPKQYGVMIDAVRQGKPDIPAPESYPGIRRYGAARTRNMVIRSSWIF